MFSIIITNMTLSSLFVYRLCCSSICVCMCVKVESHFHSALQRLRHSEMREWNLKRLSVSTSSLSLCLSLSVLTCIIHCSPPLCLSQSHKSSISFYHTAETDMADIFLVSLNRRTVAKGSLLSSTVHTKEPHLTLHCLDFTDFT